MKNKGFCLGGEGDKFNFDRGTFLSNQNFGNALEEIDLLLERYLKFKLSDKDEIGNKLEKLNLVEDIPVK